VVNKKTIDMKKLLIILGLVLSISTMYAQELLEDDKEPPRNICRYDFKEVGKFQNDTYTVLVITNCMTNDKEYKLMISYEDYRYEGKKVSYFSDGVVAELLKGFHYLITTEFAPGQEGDKSFVIYEICDDLYFKYRIGERRFELWINEDHLLAKIFEENTIKEYASFLYKIEQTFSEKGRDLKDAKITDENKKEPRVFQL
jgi:hypothetical protein